MSQVLDIMKPQSQVGMPLIIEGSDLIEARIAVAPGFVEHCGTIAAVESN